MRRGEQKLDEALPIHDKTRAEIGVELAWNAARAREVWQALLAKIDEHPITGVGGSYSREELYDRN